MYGYHFSKRRFKDVRKMKNEGRLIFVLQELYTMSYFKRDDSDEEDIVSDAGDNHSASEDGTVVSDIDSEDDFEEPHRGAVESDSEDEAAANGHQMLLPDGEGDPHRTDTDELSDDDDDDDSTASTYMQKFNRGIHQNYLATVHPECTLQNLGEVAQMSKVARDALGDVIDPLHTTGALLTKFERARVIGQRANQINAGAPPFIDIPADVIDGYTIACMELAAKRIPFIICRPIPGGGNEFWPLHELENLG